MKVVSKDRDDNKKRQVESFISENRHWFILVGAVMLFLILLVVIVWYSSTQKKLQPGVDTFRYINADKIDAYSWWSYRFNARAKNVGWRIDYFFISKGLKDKLKDAFILNEIEGSDHCPVGIDIDL